MRQTLRNAAYVLKRFGCSAVVSFAFVPGPALRSLQANKLWGSRRYKKTIICQEVAKAKNVCQVGLSFLLMFTLLFDMRCLVLSGFCFLSLKALDKVLCRIHVPELCGSGPLFCRCVCSTWITTCQCKSETKLLEQTPTMSFLKAMSARSMHWQRGQKMGRCKGSTSQPNQTTPS